MRRLFESKFMAEGFARRNNGRVIAYDPTLHCDSACLRLGSCSSGVCKDRYEVVDIKLYEVEQVVRYDDGPTALMQITFIQPGHGGQIAYYHGRQCMGGTCAAYHENIVPATAFDLEMWRIQAKWRKEPTSRETVFGFPIGSKE